VPSSLVPPAKRTEVQVLDRPFGPVEETRSTLLLPEGHDRELQETMKPRLESVEIPVGSRELELHDATIQTLYGMGLRLQYCAEVLDVAPDQVRVALVDVIASLDEVVERLRNRIYEIN
jgi:hypothetical protein